MTTEPTGDWRDRILADLHESAVTRQFNTFPSAVEIMKIAAYNRRMMFRDFVGRAALSVAVYDFRDEITWFDANEKEPPLRDIRLPVHMPQHRHRGRNFGPWQIEGMSE